MGKTKKWETFSGLQKGAISVLIIKADFSDFQSGQEGLQIGAALGISNWSQKITIRGRDLKLGQRDFKLGQRLQIEEGEGEGQEGFQIGTEIMVQNRVNITLELISNYLELPGVSR